jgi:RNA recognition motif-containing protein
LRHYDSCFKCKATKPGRATNGNISSGAGRGLSIPATQSYNKNNNSVATQPAGQSFQQQQNTASDRAPTQGTETDGFEVFVKYLPHTAEEGEVAELFSRYGALMGDVRLMRNPATGACKGAGFVSFVTEASRAAALAGDGAKFGGRHLSITVAKTGTFGVRATEQAFGRGGCTS